MKKVKIIVNAEYDETKNHIISSHVVRRFTDDGFDHVKVTIEEELDYSKLIDCAAYLAPDGRIWTGKRHHNVIKTIIQATGVKQVGQGYISGFVTMAGNFIDRETAYKLVKETNQKMKGDLSMDGYDELYSEMLY